MTKVIFRCDGNSKIGLGHIIRSLALADMLKTDFECVFLCQNLDNNLQKQITKIADLKILPETDNYLTEVNFITQNYLSGNEIIVLDGYNFDTEYQKSIKSKGSKLICIDDIHTIHFVADVIINHAGGVKVEDYSTESYTKFCLGTDYALLRKPFLEATKKQRKITKIENIFICFGGSDIHNLTKKTVEACLSISEIKRIVLVLGSAYTHQKSDFENDKIEIHQNLSASKMVEVMQSCELAIAPASSISYEICAIGMAFIGGYYVENQKNIASFLSEKKLAKIVGNFRAESIQETLMELIENKKIISEMIDAQYQYFQNSTPNFVKVFRKLALEFELAFQEATLEDMKLYFDWANDEVTRQNALHPEPILWETHQKWFKNRLCSESSILYICLWNKTPIGQVRFDKIENDIYDIDYAIDAKYRGKGFGKVMLQNALKKMRQNKSNICFYATVKTRNIGSQKIFEQLSFTITNQDNQLIMYQQL